MPNEHKGRQDLILIRHSVPNIQQDIPAASWQLSEEGKRRCHALATTLQPRKPAWLITSVEPKAEETGQLAAESLSLPCESVPGLHEHDRRHVPFMGKDALVRSVERLFREPSQLVFGAETANQAAARFETAIDEVLARRDVGPPAIVSHGTVISLFVSQITGEDPFPLWRRLGMPAMIVVSPARGRILEFIPEID